MNVVAGLLCWLTIPVATTADGSKGKDSPEVHERALRGADAEAQRAAIDALTRYDQGFDLLAAFILKNPESKNVGQAIQALNSYSRRGDFEGRILELRTRLLGKKGYERAEVKKEKVKRVTISQEGMQVDEVEVVAPAPAKHWAAQVLTRILWRETGPARYAGEMLEVLLDRLPREMHQLGFGPQLLKDVIELNCHVEKQQLRRLVPALIDCLGAFFPDNREGAHLCLMVITGKAYQFDPAARGEANARTIRLYREWHETEVKSGN
jgi:hypothetical protein